MGDEPRKHERTFERLVPTKPVGITAEQLEYMLETAELGEQLPVESWAEAFQLAPPPKTFFQLQRWILLELKAWRAANPDKAFDLNSKELR